MEIGQSHSNFALENLKDRALAIEFFSTLLPNEIIDAVRLESLKVDDGALIDRKLSEHRTDLLFKVESRNGISMNIALLFEHKSSPDSRLPFQLLRYISVLFDRQVNPAPVLPIVFYHGHRKWNVSASLHGALEWADSDRQGLAHLVPNFEYALINTADIDLKGIRASLQLKIFLTALKHIRDFSSPEKYAILLGQASALFKERDKLKFLEQLLTYVYRVHDYEPEEIRILIDEHVGRGLGDIAMTTAEKLEQQGIEKGISKGIEQGIERGKLETARKMHEKGMPVEEILEITGLERQALTSEGLI